MEIKFTKAVGAGNDFVIIESGLHKENFIRSILNRHFGIGGDGLITYKENRMVFYNPDGNRVPYCGNGTRILFFYLYKNGTMDKRGIIKTDAGDFFCELVSENKVRTEMPECKILKENIIECGVPHLIIPVGSLEEIDVENEGKNRSYAIKGRTNVNWVKEGNEGLLYMRTFERGVEGETLSCGSGVASVGFWYIMKKGFRSIKIETKGGTFKVEKLRGKIFLTGEVDLPFSGIYLWRNK